MRISGFTFIRNGVLLDYPFVESIRSMLPLCDEVIVVVATSTDETLQAVVRIGDARIRIFEHAWDETLRSKGQLLAKLTNEALRHVTGDWALYLQADEVLHENDLPSIMEAARRYYTDDDTDGLLFHWYHFVGNYDFIGKPGSRGLYHHEVRMFKTGRNIFSFGDAQGFRRLKGKEKIQKLNARLIPAYVYHYAKVRGPEREQLRARAFSRLWHDDQWIAHRFGNQNFEYRFSFPIIPFNGTHPAVMHERIRQRNWPFTPAMARIRIPFRYRLLNALFRLTGWRPFEFRNYRLLPAEG
ncbi:MAG: glycosyltransferase [Chitinophagales bacterium]|nr:glycosyltransferase [Chitinophagales bacterium]MDW8427462.1 glycosyltransferase [Chitinophagales bacterium]